MAEPTAGPPLEAKLEDPTRPEAASLPSKDTDSNQADGAEEKGPSKRALEKARKKAEAAAKKAAFKKDAVIRPKETKDLGVAREPTGEPKSEPLSMFDTGWLKNVYEEKAPDEGTVFTRFPPEPNGYLHIGHAKAIGVNFGFAKYRKGHCYLRFDDTNPAKEKDEYFVKIKEMVSFLGFQPYKITHSSDYFDQLYHLAEKLTERGGAYACHCTKEQIQMQRGGPDNRSPRFGCEHRDRPAAESLQVLRDMRDGNYAPGEALLRMKPESGLTDPNQGNPEMWDQPAYRIVNSPHPQTGDKWKIYPLYIYAHPICDALEGITQSLCTVEFYQSRVVYDWLLRKLDLKKVGPEEDFPYQREYGRLNVEGTILSKRRIQLLVEGGSFDVKKSDGTTTTRIVKPAVRSWDDPRLYTLIALRRRGVPAGALLSFVAELGVTTSLTSISTHKFEASIRKFLERTVPRLSLVLSPLKVTIKDVPDDFSFDITVPYDPKDTSKGSRTVTVKKELYIDTSDFQSQHDANFFRLTSEQPVGLLNVPFAVRYDSTTSDGIVVTKAEDVKKPKAYIHWVNSSALKCTARQYNTLFNAEDPNSLGWKDGSYEDALNPESEVIYDNALIEPAYRELAKKEKTDAQSTLDAIVRFQAVRTAYFAVDTECEGDEIVLNQIVSLKEDSAKGK